MVLAEGFDPLTGSDLASFSLDAQTMACIPSARDAAREPVLERLGISGLLLERYRALLHAPHGLVVVCSPSQNGKTATLHASVEERSFPGRVQKALVLDEIRDRVTATYATAAALRAQMVLATVCANNAATAVERLMHLAPGPQLAAALRGIVSQRLLRKLCVACRRWHRLSPELKKKFGLLHMTHAYRAQGCAHCNGTGYSAQIGIFALLLVDEALRGAINAGLPEAALADVAAAGGYGPMRMDGIRKARLGDTSFEELDAVMLGRTK